MEDTYIEELRGRSNPAFWKCADEIERLRAKVAAAETFMEWWDNPNERSEYSSDKLARFDVLRKALADD